MKTKEIVEALEKLRNKTETVQLDPEDCVGGPCSLEREQYVLTNKQRDLLKEAEHKIKALSKKNKELKERIAKLERDHYLEDAYPDGWTM